MRHSNALLLLEAYGPNELEPSVRARLEEHLAGCPRCSAWAKETAEFQAILGSARAASTPAGLDRAVEEVRRSVLNAARDGSRTRGIWPGWLGGFALKPLAVPLSLAALLALVFVLRPILTDDPRPTGPESAPVASFLRASTQQNFKQDFKIVRDGSEVRIEWPQNGNTHRVRKATDPGSLKAAQSRLVSGKVWADKDASQQAGTVTYYLID